MPAKSTSQGNSASGQAWFVESTHLWSMVPTPLRRNATYDSVVINVDCVNVDFTISTENVFWQPLATFFNGMNCVII